MMKLSPIYGVCMYVYIVCMYVCMYVYPCPQVHSQHFKCYTGHIENWEEPVDDAVYVYITIIESWIVALVYIIKSQDFFREKKNLTTWVGIEPTLSHLQCDALPI